MVTGKDLVVMLTETKRAVIDLRDLSVRNFGIPERVVERIIKTLDDKNLTLQKWLKVSAR
jgi:hypothetical protein